MPIIAPQRKSEKQEVNLKLDRRLAALLKAYAECIASSQEYVLNEALLAMFTGDREFRAWLDHARPGEAEALRTLLEERPADRMPGKPSTRRTTRRTVERQPTLDLAAAGRRTDA